MDGMRLRGWAAVAAGVLVGLAPDPALAEVTVNSPLGRTSVQAMSGVFDFGFAAPVVEQAPPAFTEFESVQLAAPAGPFPATAAAQQSASIDSSPDGVVARATGLARARAPLAAEPPLSNLIANATSTFAIAASSTGPAFYAISASISGA